jgi:hypothetical protein
VFEPQTGDPEPNWQAGDPEPNWQTGGLEPNWQTNDPEPNFSNYSLNLIHFLVRQENFRK